MSLWSDESTHALAADDYPIANRTVVEAALPYADTVFVCFDIEWLDEDLPDTADCEAVWTDVREEFEPLGEDRWDRDSPQFRAPLPDASGTVERLASLVDGIFGNHFLFRLALQRGGESIYFAVPHHDWTHIGVNWVGGEEFRSNVSDALAPLWACLVPDEIRIEWTKDGRQYRVETDSICVSTIDGSSTTCYGFHSVAGVTVEENGRRVSFREPDRNDSAGFAKRLLTSLYDRVVSPPDAFEFDDPATGREFARIVRETLAAYQPASGAE